MTDQVLGRSIPAPAISIETKPFWDAAEKGVFLIGRCTACGEAHFYPRALCPFCGGETELVESAGQGEIYSYSIMRRAPGGPYCVAFVTLDEGPKVLTNIVGAVDSPKIGARVKLRWESTDGGPPAPVFAVE